MRLPNDVPVMTLSNVILFPHAMLPLHIFEPRYRRMLRDALAGDRMFAVALQKPGRVREMPSPVAGLGLIRVAVENPDGTSNLILQGIARVALGKAAQTRPYRRHPVKPLEPVNPSSAEADALTARVLELVAQRLEQGFSGLSATFQAMGAQPPEAVEGGNVLAGFREILQKLAQEDCTEQLADLVSATLLSDALERQLILETPGLEDRLRLVVHFLHNEIRRRRETKE